MAGKVDRGQRYADILAMLKRTANVKLACTEAGVDESWAFRRRKADPDFAARWRAAVRTGQDALAKLSADRARHAIAIGAERGTIPGGLRLTGSSGMGTIPLEREKRDSITTAKLARFLDVLRATCNVTAAAGAAGIDPTNAYRIYHKDAAFRASWDAAVAEGRVHLEMALIGAARALIEPSGDHEVAPIAPSAITGMDAMVAVRLLKLHSPRDARGRVRGMRVKPADAESVRREILAKIAAVKAARERAADPQSAPTRQAATVW